MLIDEDGLKDALKFEVEPCPEPSARTQLALLVKKSYGNEYGVCFDFRGVFFQVHQPVDGVSMVMAGWLLVP